MSRARKATEEKILQIARADFVSPSEIASRFNLSYNTVRANYLYPMANAGLLIREKPRGARMNQRYKAAGKNPK